MSPGLAAAESSKPVILILGDSLSAGYGLDAGQSWVSLLKQKLATEGWPHEVVNAAITGETTRGGLTRLPRLLEHHQPQLVLIQLGGNDGLRALPVSAMKQNLSKMVDLSKASDAVPVLFEMAIPSNYGPTYSAQFTQAFKSLAESKDVPLAPFLLARFALDENAFQADGIHPNAESQMLMLESVWPALATVLRR